MLPNNVFYTSDVISYKFSQQINILGNAPWLLLDQLSQETDITKHILHWKWNCGHLCTKLIAFDNSLKLKNLIALKLKQLHDLMLRNKYLCRHLIIEVYSMLD